MMYQKVTVLGIVFLFASFMLPYQGLAQKLQCRKFSELDSLQHNAPRILIVFIYADWCTYCQTMRRTTFRDKRVIGLLNTDFYFSSLNAEDENDITLAGQTYKYKPTGMNSGMNELAQVLGQNSEGQVVYPSLVVASPAYEILFQYGGFITADDLVILLEKAKEVMTGNK